MTKSVLRKEFDYKGNEVIPTTNKHRSFLLKGFNYALNYYQKRDDSSSTPRKKYDVTLNSQPEAMKAKGEASIPISDQYTLGLNVY